MSKVTMKPFSFADESADNIPFSVDTLEPIQETPAEETPQSTTTETPETTSSFSFEEDSPETGEGEEQIAEPSQETPKLTSSDVEFKTLGDFLVESGIWKDFEGREEFEYKRDLLKVMLKGLFKKFPDLKKEQIAELLKENDIQEKHR